MTSLQKTVTLSVALAGAVSLALSSISPCDAKARKYSRHGLVPPPPAYMPSILPELLAVDTSAPKPKKKAKPKPDTVAKHVYFAKGYEEVKPVRTGKNVTYWNQPADSPVRYVQEHKI